MRGRLAFRFTLPLLIAGLLLVVVTACDRQDNHWDGFDPARKILTIQSDTLRLAEGGEAR